MNVKSDLTYYDKIREILKNQNGILFTSDLTEKDIPRTYLSLLEKHNEIQRIARGVYSTRDAIVDEMYALQAKYKNAIFSHETALFLHDLTDRSPLRFSVTVPAGYNATILKSTGTKVYFVKSDLFPYGIAPGTSPFGNEVKTYNLERTICDVLRSRNQMEPQVIGEALRRYVAKKEKNFDLLDFYARKFRVQKIARAYIEILL